MKKFMSNCGDSLLFALASIVPSVASAQSWWQKYCEPLGACGHGSNLFIDIAGGVTRMVLALIGGTAVLMAIYGGIRLIVSFGNDQARDEAKKIITTALVGLILALAAAVIIRFVGNFIISGVGYGPSLDS